MRIVALQRNLRDDLRRVVAAAAAAVDSAEYLFSHFARTLQLPKTFNNKQRLLGRNAKITQRLLRTEAERRRDLRPALLLALVRGLQDRAQTVARLLDLEDRVGTLRVLLSRRSPVRAAQRAGWLTI